jgi:hypothetical protein
MLLINGGAIYSSDGISMYEVTKSVVEDGDVSITHGVVWEGRDGRYYAPFGIGLSLAALPVYLLIRPIATRTTEPERVTQAAVAALLPVIIAFLAIALYRLARRLGAGPRDSVLVAMGAVAGTFVLVYSKDFFTEPLATLFVVVSVERAVARRPLASGAAAAGAMLTRPQFLAFAPLLLWRTQRDAGWFASLKAAWPLALGLSVNLGYNLVRFGSVTNFGYSDPLLKQGFTTPFYQGAAGLLLHPQKSILLFAPIAVLIIPALRWLWASQRTGFWLIAGNLAITFTLTATWWDWGGGWLWGPRLLIPGVIPAIAAIAPWVETRSAVMRRTVVILFVVGAFVSLPAVLLGGGAQLADSSPPERGPSVIRQFELLPDAVSFTAQHLFERDVRDTSLYLTLWQFALARRAGPPGLLVALGVSLVLFIGVVIFGIRLRRNLQCLAPPHDSLRQAPAKT